VSVQSVGLVSVCVGACILDYWIVQSVGLVSVVSIKCLDVFCNVCFECLAKRPSVVSLGWVCCSVLQCCVVCCSVVQCGVGLGVCSLYVCM